MTGLESRASYVLRTEFDALRMRRMEDEKLCRKGGWSPSLSEALVVIVSTPFHLTN